MLRSDSPYVSADPRIRLTVKLMSALPLSSSAGTGVESRVVLVPPAEKVNEVQGTRYRGSLKPVRMGTGSKGPVYFALSIPPNRIEPN